MTEEEYTTLITEWGKVERKGKKNPYTSLNGHMFTFLDTKEGYLAIRFSEKEKKAFNEKHDGSDVIQYNSVMRGYIRVPEKMANDKITIIELLDKSYNYIASLEPKPTKKRK